MITGFNTDVEHQDRVYHVQTEDRGLKHPVIESLVYCGGEIIASRRLPYGEYLDTEGFGEEQIQQRLDQQHKRLIREIRNGKFDTEQLMPFGHTIVTNRSFDETVLGYLHDHVALEQIQLRLTGPRVLREGASPKLRVEVVERGSGRPVTAATVTIALVAAGTPGRELFSGLTDERGAVQTRVQIPALDGAPCAVVCQVRAGQCAAEIKRAVHPARRRAEATASPTTTSSS